MTLWKCPGQDRNFWQPGDIFEAPCPKCGENVEFWKDDITIRCPHCRQLINNPRFNPGCAAYCSFAENCLGSLGKEIQQQPEIMKTRLEIALRKLLCEQPHLVNRAVKAAARAEKLAGAQVLDAFTAIVAALLLPWVQSMNVAPQEIEEFLSQAGVPQEKASRILRAVEAVRQGDRLHPYYRLLVEASGD